MKTADNQFERNVDFYLADCLQMVKDGFLKASEVPSKSDIRSVGPCELASMCKQIREINSI